MKAIFATAIISAVIFSPALAIAGERENDMALGAASGALVGGPVGLVAGGVIGYIAGPDIGRSFGLNRHRSYRNRVPTASNVDTRPTQDAVPDAPME